MGMFTSKATHTEAVNRSTEELRHERYLRDVRKGNEERTAAARACEAEREAARSDDSLAMTDLIRWRGGR